MGTRNREYPGPSEPDSFRASHTSPPDETPEAYWRARATHAEERADKLQRTLHRVQNDCESLQKANRRILKRVTAQEALQALQADLKEREELAATVRSLQEQLRMNNIVQRDGGTWSEMGT